VQMAQREIHKHAASSGNSVSARNSGISETTAEVVTSRTEFAIINLTE
jgi:hypothetical protein